MERLRQCGRVGTFTMSGDAVLDEAAMKKAVEKGNLKVATVNKVRRQKAQRDLRFSFSKPST